MPPLPKKPTLDPGDERLLIVLAKSTAMRPASPRDLPRLEHLSASGYVVRDPAMKLPTFRLTVRGWDYVRSVCPKLKSEEITDGAGA